MGSILAARAGYDKWRKGEAAKYPVDMEPFEASDTISWARFCRALQQQSGGER